MSSPDQPASPPRYQYMLECPCGAVLEAATEDGIVELSQAHLSEVHPDMAGTYERHHILFMARRVRV